jgi:hypothetical protein
MNEDFKNKAGIIGFREWVSLPGLNLPAIKGKVDTGAKTSSLHAFDIKLQKINGKSYINFKVHPIQEDEELVIFCRSPLFDSRIITDSGGHKEQRYVIKTTLIVGGMRK